jgi:predicted ATP-binding protein involved in virulence
LENTELADRFLEMAKVVYEFDCYFDKEVEDKNKRYFTDFVINKWGTKVHFKSMSDGERKIATLLAGLCDETYMSTVDIVLVDNIEMHIYFKRHSAMIDKLLECFPDKQILATTHSGVLINHISPKYKYDLEKYKEIEVIKLAIQTPEGLESVKSAADKETIEMLKSYNVYI